MQPIDFSRIKRILVTRTDRIGDLVLSTPVFPEIKKRYPESHLTVLVFKETEAVVRGNPWIDQVIVYDKKGSYQSWWRTILFGLRLRKEHFDIAIHLHATNRVNVISWLAAIPVRIGYRVKAGDRHGNLHHFLTHVVDEKKWQGKYHEADYNFDLLALVDVPRPEQLELYFPLPDSDREVLERMLPERFNQRYVVFHPSASCISKRWSPTRLATVADQLSRDYGIFPVIIGEGLGALHAAQMQEFMKEKSLNLAGQLNLGMLGRLLKGARLLISNDSGPVHIASAVGTPVISIFGRNKPGLSAIRWHPLSKNSSFIQKDVGCIECLAHKCQIDFKCLTELTAADVLGEARKYEPFFV